MTETNFVDISFNYFQSYMSNEGYKFDDFSIDSKYVKAIFLEKVCHQNSKKFVEKISDSTKSKIGLQQNIHDSTISDKEKEMDNLDYIERVAERTIYLLLCLSVDLPDHILSNWNLDPDKQIYYSRSQTKTGLRNWVYELIAVLSPLSKHYDSVNTFVHDVGLCAHCALLDTAPTGARHTADWMFPRTNIPKGSMFMQRIKQANNQNEKFHKDNPLDLIHSFYSCFNNFIKLASSLGYCNSKQQVAIDTTYIPTGADAPEDLTIDGSSSSRTEEKYGERRWIYQIATMATYPSKFILSVEPIYDLKKKHLRLEPQLQQFLELDLNIDTVLCDSRYYDKKSIRKLRKYRKDWIVRAEVRGDSDIAQLVNNVRKTGIPKYTRSVEISTPPLTPRPNAFAYPNTDDLPSNDDGQIILSELGNTDSNDEDDRERFTDANPDKKILAYVIGGDINNDTMRKSQILYRSRRRIESKFGQIKENGLANTESYDPAVRYYIMAMGCMFHNFHYMINRSMTPKYGIPSRDISLKQWLCAIQDVAFSN